MIAAADHRQRLRHASMIPEAETSIHVKPQLPNRGKQDSRMIECDRGHGRRAQIRTPNMVGVSRRRERRREGGALGSASLAAAATILRGGGEADDPLACLRPLSLRTPPGLTLCPDTAARVHPRLSFVEP